MSEQKVLAFDLEIVKEIHEGQDWQSVRPLGISCIGLAQRTESVNHGSWLSEATFYHGQSDSIPYEGAMTRGEVENMLYFAQEMINKGYQFLTWNGLSFDFDVLAEESGQYELCKELALNSIDMMFQIVCIKGYPVGMDTVAKGLGLHGKTEGMHGDLAPVIWRGTLEERQKVLEYVGQDAITTYEIYERALQVGGVKWTSRSGRPMFVPIKKWLTVRECLELPVPDTSWMINPRMREDYMSWIKE